MLVMLLLLLLLLMFSLSLFNLVQPLILVATVGDKDIFRMLLSLLLLS